MLNDKVISAERGLIRIEDGKMIIDASGVLRWETRYTPS
jgi:hypothetical protein